MVVADNLVPALHQLESMPMVMSRRGNNMGKRMVMMVFSTKNSYGSRQGKYVSPKQIVGVFLLGDVFTDCTMALIAI